MSERDLMERFDNCVRAAQVPAARSLLEEIVALRALERPAEPVGDEFSQQVEDGLYGEKVDEVLSLIEALEAIATLNAGHDEQSREVRRIALKAIAEQHTDGDAAGDAKMELAGIKTRVRPPAGGDGGESEPTTHQLLEAVAQLLDEHNQRKCALLVRKCKKEVPDVPTSGAWPSPKLSDGEMIEEACPNCHGDGPHAECPQCKGTGYVPSAQGEVRVPRRDELIALLITMRRAIPSHGTHSEEAINAYEDMKAMLAARPEAQQPRMEELPTRKVDMSVDSLGWYKFQCPACDAVVACSREAIQANGDHGSPARNIERPEGDAGGDAK